MCPLKLALGMIILNTLKEHLVATHSLSVIHYIMK